MSNAPDEPASEEMRDVIKVDGNAVHGHLDELVRTTVEETLNNLLDAEADKLCGAKRYERSAGIDSIREQAPITARSRRTLEK